MNALNPLNPHINLGKDLAYLHIYRQKCLMYQSDPQAQPISHHSLALDLGQSQQRKGRDPGLLLRGTMVALKFTETAGTSLASATTFFGAGHTLKGNEA